VKAKETRSVSQIFDAIVKDTKFREYIEDDDEFGESRWENVQELRRQAFEFNEKELSDYLQRLALVSDQDTLPEKQDAPILLTLHAAKGLEFDTVYIVGMDEGLLPHARSRDEPEEMSEERRLFYVGVTRAKNHLHLVRAEQRTSFGAFEYNRPSQFLDSIPEELISRQGARIARGSKSRLDAYSGWSLPTSSGSHGENHARILEPKYKAGMRVKHETWGEGLVVDIRVQDNEERIDVFFDSVGFKRLLASLAKLEILN